MFVTTVHTTTTLHSCTALNLHILPCVWLWDVWVGLAPSFVLGMEPTRLLFSCNSDFGDGINPSHVWLKELRLRVGWQGNTVMYDTFISGP
jgi:hypothetical protein